MAETHVGPVIIELYRRLLERKFAHDDPEVVVLTAALTKNLENDNRGDRPTEVLLMASLRKQRVLDGPSFPVMKWSIGTLSGSEWALKPGLGTATYPWRDASPN